MTRQLLARVFLATALVVAQYGVFAHALSHLDKARYGHDGGVPAGHAAEICVAFAAAAGGALAAGELPLQAHPSPDGHAAPLAPADPFLPALALTRFASRAPPLPA
jgi:hypothetical protein